MTDNEIKMKCILEVDNVCRVSVVLEPHQCYVNCVNLVLVVEVFCVSQEMKGEESERMGEH